MKTTKTESPGFAWYLGLVSDLASRESFEGLGELATAVKDRCARLRVAYDPRLVNDAVARIGAQRWLHFDDRPVRPREERPVRRPLTHHEACRILARLGARVKTVDCR